MMIGRKLLGIILVLWLVLGNAQRNMVSNISLEEKEISNKSALNIKNPLPESKETNVKTDYWAVIVSIGDYKGNDHDIPLNDSELSCLYNAILAANNWNTSHVKLLLNENATRNAIINAFNWLKEKSGPNDIILFSFLGHGSEVPDINGDEKDGYDEGIVPWEGMEGFITDDELSELFNGINAKGMCIIFDCCLSGSLVENSQPIIKTLKGGYLKELSTDIETDHKVILTSTLPNSLGGSLQIKNPFTNRTRSSFFLKWIATAFGMKMDFNNDGICSAEEAFLFAKMRILPFSILLLNPIWQLIALKKAGHPILEFPQIYDGYLGPLPIVIK